MDPGLYYEDALATLSNILQQLPTTVRSMQEEQATAMDEYMEVQPFYQRQSISANLQIDALFLRFREAYRKMNNYVQEAKSNTLKAKEEMDRQSFAVQNLIYEQRHLELELEQCRDFKTLYDTIDVVSVNEFQDNASRVLVESAEQSAHQLMLNRLQFELSERQRLMVLFEEHDQRRKLKVEELKQQKERIDKIENQFDVIVKVSRSLQETVSASPEHPCTQVSAGQALIMNGKDDAESISAQRGSESPSMSPLKQPSLLEEADIEEYRKRRIHSPSHLRSSQDVDPDD